MRISKAFFATTSLCSGLLLAALAAPAWAADQATPDNNVPSPPGPASQSTTPPPSAAEGPRTPEAAAATSVGELVVTGSHIRRSNYNVASPVQVITKEDTRLEGLFDPGQVLQLTPQAAGYAQVNNQLSGFVVNGGPGVDTIGLRGLTPDRTLVLLNGRRLNPSGVSGTVASVDLNVIPDALVDRYEILTDGASSIYGSDAIGGVVNIITRDRFDGLNAELNGSFPTRGGSDEEFSISGGQVRDNYHVLFGVQYSNQDALKIRDLPNGACPRELQRLPTGGGYTFGRSYANGQPYCANEQTDNISNFFNLGTGGLDALSGIWVYDPTQPANFPYSPFQQDPFGTVPRHTNIATDPRTADVDAISPVQRLGFTVIGGVDLPHNMEFYFEDLVTNRRSQQDAFLPQFFPATGDDAFAVSITPFNPFIDPATGFPDFVQPILTLPVSKFTQDVWAGRFVFGLRGDFGGFMSGWKWDGSVTYGLSRASYTETAQLSDRVHFALDDVVAPAGTPGNEITFNPVDGKNYTCRINLTNPNAGCAPINWFQNSLAFDSSKAFDYINTTETGHTKYDQVIVSGTADGPLFSLPAGAVQGVVGAEFRYDALNDTPSPDAIKDNYFNLSTAGVTKGDESVWELYGEVEAPLLKAVPLVDNLTLNVSGRYTNYRTAGSDGTYKIGLNWQIIPSLRIRATYGTSFRGPALFENYLAAQTSFTGATDPCAQYGTNADPKSNLFKNCQAAGLPLNFLGYNSTPEVFTQGALGRLRPETSKNLTVGPVFQPSWADLRFSVDYFRIQLDNQITTLGPQNLLNFCYESNEFYNGSPYCTLISKRDSQGNIALIDDSYLNVAKQTISGLDFNLDYRKQFSFGTASLKAAFTYNFEDNQQLFQGSAASNFTGTFGEPRLVGNFDARFRHGPWTFLWNSLYLGEQVESGLTGDPIDRYNETQGDQWYHTISITYKADKWQVTAGIRNLLDDYPPTISNNPSTAFAPRVGEFANGYGNLQLFGRTFFFSLSKDF
jgi:iron complex outermembrane receptor protein